MEIRTLRYFLTAAKEENITHAAEILHITQPALSKQIRMLEEELGKKLFIRHNFSIELTEEGRLLQKRAEDLVEMADKITDEFMSLDDIIGGTIYLGLAESYQIRYLTEEIRAFKSLYPHFHYSITSGDTEQVMEKLDKGLLDFGVIMERPNEHKYDLMKLPEKDVWGLLISETDALAQKEKITIDDLQGRSIFISPQSWEKDIPRWCGARRDELKLEGTFRLAYNGSLFVKAGLGSLFTIKNLVYAGEGSGLVFRPLEPILSTELYLIWKRGQKFTPLAARFLEHMKAVWGTNEK